MIGKILAHVRAAATATAAPMSVMLVPAGMELQGFQREPAANFLVSPRQPLVQGGPGLMQRTQVTGIKQNEIEPVSFPLSSIVTDPTTNLKIGIHYPLLSYDQGTRNPMAQGHWPARFLPTRIGLTHLQAAPVLRRRCTLCLVVATMEIKPVKMVIRLGESGLGLALLILRTSPESKNLLVLFSKRASSTLGTQSSRRSCLVRLWPLPARIPARCWWRTRRPRPIRSRWPRSR